jgi:hypothetical protein
VETEPPVQEAEKVAVEVASPVVTAGAPAEATQPATDLPAAEVVLTPVAVASVETEPPVQEAEKITAEVPAPIAAASNDIEPATAAVSPEVLAAETPVETVHPTADLPVAAEVLAPVAAASAEAGPPAAAVSQEAEKPVVEAAPPPAEVVSVEDAGPVAEPPVVADAPPIAADNAAAVNRQPAADAHIEALPTATEPSAEAVAPPPETPVFMPNMPPINLPAAVGDPKAGPKTGMPGLDVPLSEPTFAPPSAAPIPRELMLAAFFLFLVGIAAFFAFR